MKNTKNIQHDVGFLIYNIPSPTLDYSTVAKICVRHLKHHMPHIPVAVCGAPIDQADINIPIEDIAHNQRTYVHKREVHKETWYNLTRDRSLDVTPFERTVLMDSDYIVQTNQLELLLQSQSPIMMYDRIYNIKEDSVEIEYLGSNQIAYANFDNKISMKWATVLAFDHSEPSKQLFAYWKQAIKNYRYYELMYKWRNDGTIWNDKAITIAHQQLTNYTNSNQYVIPWHHPFASFACDVDYIGLDKIILRDPKGAFEVKTDVHILNKKELLKHGE
jgi:hypothetical protein